MSISLETVLTCLIIGIPALSIIILLVSIFIEYLTDISRCLQGTADQTSKSFVVTISILIVLSLSIFIGYSALTHRFPGEVVLDIYENVGDHFDKEYQEEKRLEKEQEKLEKKKEWAERRASFLQNQQTLVKIRREIE